MGREEKVFRVSGIRTCIARRSSAGATTLNINKLNLLDGTMVLRNAEMQAGEACSRKLHWKEERARTVGWLGLARSSLFPTRIVRREKPLNVTTSGQRGKQKSCCKGERWRKRRWCGSFRKIV
ncbi:hypothetical protein ALC57_01923 [Trachymyrmex cornetzi]|uniref:Uncharacterized protein n=1 Tax=Trachymyrmex cornetzi TaxID=471704 RepID=A0A195EK80_9HYME|nr:hypothetical protein ALC57_01923 [Trachymyrmex cornetzi]